MPQGQIDASVRLTIQDILEKSKGTPQEHIEQEAMNCNIPSMSNYNLEDKKKFDTIVTKIGQNKGVLIVGDTGYLTNLIAFQNNKVTLLSNSGVITTRAKFLMGIDAVFGNYEEMPFFDRVYDFIVVVESLGSQRNVGSFWNELERVLKDDGTILFTHLLDKNAMWDVNTEICDKTLLLSCRKNSDNFNKFSGFDFRTTNISSVSDFPNNGRNNLVIKGLLGLGDNIDQRNFVKELKFPLYLETPWPQLYKDLPNVRCIRPQTDMRTQSKNISRVSYSYQAPINNAYILTVVKGVYDHDILNSSTILSNFSDVFGGIKPTTFDMPQFKSPIIHPKIAMIRPVTSRSEWHNTSRNPDPKYMVEAASILKKHGYYIVSTCDLETGREWIEGMEPYSDLKFHHGELGVEELLGLTQQADIIVGGIGWLLQAALATHKPTLMVLGGYGGTNSPKQVADSKIVDSSNITWIIPDNFCGCTEFQHKCNKEIKDFGQKMGYWMEKIKEVKND